MVNNEGHSKQRNESFWHTLIVILLDHIAHDEFFQKNHPKKRNASLLYLKLLSEKIVVLEYFQEDHLKRRSRSSR